MPVKVPVKETLKERAVLLAEASTLLAVEVGALTPTFFLFETSVTHKFEQKVSSSIGS